MAQAEQLRIHNDNITIQKAILSIQKDIIGMLSTFTLRMLNWKSKYNGNDAAEKNLSVIGDIVMSELESVSAISRLLPRGTASLTQDRYSCL
jgi:hypothetical protein